MNMLSFNLSNKTFLLTGSDGFLGQHIKNALISEQATVICIDKFIKNNKTLTFFTYTYINTHI